MTKLESLKTYVKLPIEDILERQADTIQKMYRWWYFRRAIKIRNSI